MQQQYDRIILHAKPHADELLALLLLQKWGGTKFHGVETAEICLFGGGSRLVSHNLPKGTLAIGLGGGVFDEHGRGEGKEEECTATLVAKKLGITQHLPLTKILAQTLREDRNGSRLKDEIPSIVKILHMVGVDFKKVLEWYRTIFWAEYHHEEKIVPLFSRKEFLERFHNLQETTLDYGYELIKEVFGLQRADQWKTIANKALTKRQEMFLQAKKEWKSEGKSFWWNSVFGKIRIGYAKSDSPLMNSAARNCGVDLFVQQNSLGNVQIFTDKKCNIDLTEVAKQIRIAEVRKGKGKYPPISDTRSLSMEGTHPMMPIWHLLEGKHSRLFNGSLTADGVEPTALTLEEILSIGKKTIDERNVSQEKLVYVKNAFEPTACN